MFLGALFQTVKGGYDAITIRKKIKELKKELDGDLLGQLDAYEQFAATERLLLAEYMIHSSKLQARGCRLNKLLSLRERMNCQMKNAIENARTELEARPATKLDVARLVSGLRELSIAIDRDLAVFRKELQNERKKIQADMEALEKRLQEQGERIERENNRVLSMEERAQTFYDNLEGLVKEFKTAANRDTRRTALVWVFNILVAGLILFLIWR